MTKRGKNRRSFYLLSNRHSAPLNEIDGAFDDVYRLQSHFTALGFLAVMLDNVPRDRQALRATNIAQSIEAFCATGMPEAFMSDASARAAETEQVPEPSPPLGMERS